MKIIALEEHTVDRDARELGAVTVLIAGRPEIETMPSCCIYKNRFK